MDVKKLSKKILKIIAWLIGIVLFLIILVFILIQIPAVQNFAKNKIVSYIEGKIKTKVEIGKLTLSFPKSLVLENIYFEDQHKDTLLFAGKVEVDIAMLKLLSSEVNISYVGLNNIKTHIYRNYPDTAFNYDYIVKAFSSEEESEPNEPSSPMKFNIGKISLKKILATFKDDASGNDVYFYLDDLETSFKTLNPDKSVYSLNDINIDDVITKIRQYKPLLKISDNTTTESTDTTTFYPSISINSLAFNKVLLKYNDEVAALNAFVNLGALSAHPDKINLQHLDFGLKDLTLKNSITKVSFGKPKTPVKNNESITSIDTSESSGSWKFSLAKVDLINNEIIYDDSTSKPQAEGFDPSHIHIKNLLIDGDSLQFTPDVYQGNINQLVFHEKSGVEIQKFHTKFLYNDSGASLTNLLLQTEGTTLQNQLIVKYPSIEAITKNIGDLYIDAKLPNSQIAVKDLIAFLPSYKRNFQDYKISTIKLNASAKGLLKNLSVPIFELSGFGNTYVNVSGTFKGLPDVKKANYDISINQLRSTKRDIVSLLPPNTLPNSFNLPDNLSANGFFKGNMNSFATQIALRTNKGNIQLNGNIQPGEVYVIKAGLQNVDAGYLAKQQQVGLITANLTANGIGFDIKKAVANYNLDVSSAQYNGYTYKDVIVNGNIDKGLNHSTATIKDDNIALQLDATADLSSGTYPPVKMDLMIDTLNAKTLHLMDDTLSVSGHIVADLPSTNPDDLLGNISLDKFSLTRSGQHVYVDSILLIASGDSTNKSIVIHADSIINADLLGKYKLTEIAQSLQQTINKYYAIPGYEQKNTTSENWKLNALIHPKGWLLQFIPELKGSDSIFMAGHFNSEQNDFGIEATSSRIIYGENQINGLSIAAQTSADTLHATVSVDELTAGSNHLFATELKTAIANNEISIDANSKDTKNNSQYAIGAILSEVGNGYKISLKPGLLLNYDKWNVAPGNSIYYDSTGIIVNNFNISQGNQSLNINSVEQSSTAPVKIDLKNFEIATITRLAHQDSLLASGTINGTAAITNPTKEMVFTSDIGVNNLTYKLDTIGNLAIKVDNKTANAYNMNIALTGNKNNAKLSGLYYTGDGRMDLNFDLSRFNLVTVKPFATGQLDDITGILKGNVAIKGTTDAPQVNGSLSFQRATLVPTLLGVRFKLPKDDIAVDNKGIHFKRFVLQDSAGKRAVLNGDILTNDFKTYTTDLTLRADDFTLVNKEQTTNALFYGKLNLDAKASIKGDLFAPTVSGKLRVNKETDFTFIVPQTDPEAESRIGVVNFIDKDHPETITNNSMLDSAAFNRMTGIDMNADIEVDSSAKFTIVIDERNGDALTLKGVANLNGGIDKSGKMTLTGAYELQNGSYNLSLSLLKKQFIIQKGSTVTWTGDPMTANINVTALYMAKTAPIDLMQTSLAGKSSTEITRYKEKLPFQVTLQMTGQLLKPIIHFGISLPDREASQWNDVATKLQQLSVDESELNKQVFALLLLGRFVQENPFASSAGTSAEDQIRASASRILTDQLNQLAGNLIKGVDINFDLSSGTDYSSGTAAEKTDLNVTVSKKLLNDRLRVNVGSNFQVEGPSNTNQNAINPAGDVSMDYQITKDGRYMIRVYRLNKYEGVIEGQVVETGVSFILTFDYDKLKELFTVKKEAKKIRQKNKQDKTESNTSKVQIKDKNIEPSNDDQ
ncbi:MAG: translocation/assembly module TamB domain-containing protein [Bacteroidetes bacterium]|nr:translocation/assembly module TamB domain-containing protein [Bacteroidota bacterium]